MSNEVISEFSSKLDTLSMNPGDWAKLNSLISSDEYHKLVVEYQNKEQELYPECRSPFGLCRHYLFGKCTYGYSCVFKIK